MFLKWLLHVICVCLGYFAFAGAVIGICYLFAEFTGVAVVALIALILFWAAIRSYGEFVDKHKG